MKISDFTKNMKNIENETRFEPSGPIIYPL